ncbi:MAG: CHASE2 domain-containing protein [Vicinamibacteria bacterium]
MRQRRRREGAPDPSAVMHPTRALPRPSRADRLAARMSSWPAKIAIAIALIAVGVMLAWVPAIRAIDLALLDAKFALLAKVAPIRADDGIAIVGLDEASLEALDEPLALSHRTLGAALFALARAKPRAVGLDVVLPDRSYDAFVPGADQALVTGVLALRQVAPVVLGLAVREDGTPRPVHAPLLAAAGSAGFAVLPQDDDGRIRRFDEALEVGGGTVPTLAGELSRALGATPEPGLIQYALGEGYDYVPLRDVLRWAAEGRDDELVARFGGRPVLVGAILPFEDRKRQPVPLARWERTLDVPGVLVHAQALRTALAGATVREAPWPLTLAFLVVAATLWFVRDWRWRLAALIGAGVVAYGVSTLLLRFGIELPLGAVTRVALTATAVRTTIDAWQLRIERARLKTLFGGYVSPGVLAAILDGRLDAEAQRGHRTLAFLFADIRGFTTMSAQSPPEDVLDLLNRYFDAIAPVVHAHGGTIDNFRGDGLMAIFGAPNALASPANAAIDTARAMFGAVDGLNRALATEGRPPIRFGVSAAIGEAVVGNVGSRDRYTYTALGDAANVAAHLQEFTKSSGYPLIATAALVAAAAGPPAEGWTALGVIALHGHGPVDIAGWSPVRMLDAPAVENSSAQAVPGE